MDNGGNRITNVAAGINPTDAVNVGQLNEVENRLTGRINSIDKKLRAGIAGTMAAVALPQSHRAGTGMIAVSGGTYGGESAIAIGASRISDNGKMAVKLIGSSNTRGDLSGGIGIGYEW